MNSKVKTVTLYKRQKKPFYLELMNKPVFLKATLVFLVLALPAFAYVDPGSGSMILQVILAGLLGGLFAVKVFWRKVVAFFRQLTGKKNPPPADE